MINLLLKLMKKLILILCLIIMSSCSYQKDEQVANGTVIGEGETRIQYVSDSSFVDGDLNNNYRYFAEKIIDVKDLLPDKIIKINYVENGKIYFNAFNSNAEIWENYLCCYDLENKQVEILDVFKNVDFYISSFVYTDDALVYSEMIDHSQDNEIIAKYTVKVMDDSGTYEVDQSDILGEGIYLNYPLIPSLKKVGNHVYYGTRSYEFIEEGTGMLGYKFMKIDGYEAIELFSETGLIKDNEYNYMIHGEYIDFISFHNMAGLIARTPNDTYLYLYDDQSEELQTIVLKGKCSILGFLNNQVIYVDITKDSRNSSFPYYAYDIKTGIVKQIGVDEYYVGINASDNLIGASLSSDDNYILYFNDNSLLESKMIHYENDGKGQRGANYYPLNAKEFLIIVNNKIWRCQLKEVEEID